MNQMKYPLLLSFLFAFAPLACGGDDGDTNAAADSANSDGTSGDVAINDGSNASPGATETNAVPVACAESSECPEGIECVINAGDDVGYCDVNESDAVAADTLPVNTGDEPAEDQAIVEESSGEVTSVSLGAPAICGADDECPEGIDCLIAAGDEFGYCNIEEALAADAESLPVNEGDEPPPEAAVEEETSSGVVSLGAPAMCESNSDCPDGIDCVLPEEGDIGYCDVSELAVSNLPPAE